VFELMIGLGLLTLSVIPATKFRWGTITGKQTAPPIEPSWIPRLFMIFAAMVAIIDGINQIRHHQ